MPSKSEVTEPLRTFFGLEIISGRGVRLPDIKNLPFADFWSEGATYSSQIKDSATNEWLLPATEWNEFARHFIATGRHNSMERLPVSSWDSCADKATDRAYFGLEITNQQMVREADIATLPFFEFWKESSIGSTGLVDPRTNDHLVYLHDWNSFSDLFIRTGQHRYTPRTLEK